MDSLGIAAASGLRSRMEALEIIANNMANATTAGFKADRERYGLYWADESVSALDQGRGGAGASPTIESNWTDFSQGAFIRSGSPTHAAISGDGFFAVRRGDSVAFTRNGEFQLSSNGTLVNTEGLPVLGVTGQPVRVDAARPFEIRADGTVVQGGAAAGQLRIAAFSDPRRLEKSGHNYFRWPGEESDIKRSTAQVVQGALESANTGPADGAIRMVSVLRQFESLQRAMQLGNEMGKRLVEEVAKV